MANSKISIIIPNLNGEATIGKTLDSLLKQTIKARIIVVENYSSDSSVKLINEKYPGVELLRQSKNLGFAGGVNAGIQKALGDGADYVALINNDAVATEGWLESLESELDKSSQVGISTGKLLTADGKQIDSTGDCYTNWGLPFPRGRGEITSNKYDEKVEIFAASGGASLYRVKMLEEIGLFDEDFFAYYEDVDISFRAQLAGWKVQYVPSAIAYHQMGATSSKIKGFTTYQTFKNLPLLFRKNVPLLLVPRIAPRLWFAYCLFFARAVMSGRGWPATKGVAMSVWFTPKKLVERFRIQKSRTVSVDYIWNMMTHDLPPNATALRRLRAKWWRVRGKQP